MSVIKFLVVGILLSVPTFAQFGPAAHVPKALRGGGGGPVAAPDWSGSATVIYDFESSGSPWDASGGTCTGCDMQTNNSPTRDTASPIEGSAYLDLDDTDSVECQVAVESACSAISSSLTGSVVWGSWTNPDDDTRTGRYGLNHASNSGLRISRESTFDDMTCEIGDGTDTVAHTSDAGLVEAADGWVHTICRFNDTTNTLDGFIDGVDDASGDETQESMAGGGRDFEIGLTGALGFIGQIDEFFIYEGEDFTGPDACRICSCGWSGDGCTITGSSWTTTGRNSSDCGSCTLCADASAADPGECS